MAQGEAASTVPWIVRDEKTGAPLDVIAYPKASLYGPRGSDPFIPSLQGPVTPDSAHQPALAYLPFLLTGDPYHLESLQFQAGSPCCGRPLGGSGAFASVRFARLHGPSNHRASGAGFSGVPA